MKIATVQMPMAWTIQDNVRTILESLAAAKELGADAAVFPECAVTGYHRDMGDGVTFDSIGRALRRIGGRCAELRLAALVGSPFYADAAQPKPWNAMVVIDRSGETVAAVPKQIFTRTEDFLDIFVRAGPESPRTFRLMDRACAVLICCELAGDKHRPHPHWRDIMPTLERSPDVVFVPGVLDLADDADTPVAAAARALASEFDTHVVLANWPEWGGPPPKGCLGRSMTIAPSGDILCEAPMDRPGITLATV